MNPVILQFLYPLFWIAVLSGVAYIFWLITGYQDRRAELRETGAMQPKAPLAPAKPIISRDFAHEAPVISQGHSYVSGETSTKETEKPLAQKRNGLIQHEEWWPIVTKKAVHLRLIGPTESGKSVIAQAAASEFDGKIVILDPVWKRGNWGGLPAVTVDDDGNYDPISRAIDALIGEMKARGARLKEEENPQFERLTILFDEVPDTVAELPEKAGLLVRRVGQRGRHGNIHLIGMGQSERVKAWGIEGYGDSAENFATIYLGVKALDKMAWIGDITEYPAVLEWRGKLLPIDTSEILVLSKRSIDISRVFDLRSVAQELVKPKWTEDHEKISDALDNGITGKRALARVLYPHTDGGGEYAMRADRIRREVEQVLQCEE